MEPSGASETLVLRAKLHAVKLNKMVILKIQLAKLTTRYLTNQLMHQFNLLKPTGHVMHQQFNIQQLYALPTLYLCVLYLSENKQRLVPLTA